MCNSPHIPIMVDEIRTLLNVQPTDNILDGTIGFGGHAQALLPSLTSGHYIGIDQDPKAIQFCQNHFSLQIASGQLRLIQDNYVKASNHGIMANKVLLDLGFSSYQLDSSNRGFSFLQTEPLDMRYSPSQPLTAATILNIYQHQVLSDIFYQFGDLIHNKKLVEAIIKHRPLTTTDDLIQVIKQSYHFRNRTHMMKVFSQVFQGLRIAVNDEFNKLTQFLKSLPQIITDQAIVTILTFHSGEDRLVKQFFNQHPQFKKINKKVITASQEEVKSNSRAKPAKLRGAIFSSIAK